MVALDGWRHNTSLLLLLHSHRGEQKFLIWMREALVRCQGWVYQCINYIFILTTLVFECIIKLLSLISGHFDNNPYALVFEYGDILYWKRSFIFVNLVYTYNYILDFYIPRRPTSAMNITNYIGLLKVLRTYPLDKNRVSGISPSLDPEPPWGCGIWSLKINVHDIWTRHFVSLIFW